MSLAVASVGLGTLTTLLALGAVVFRAGVLRSEVGELRRVTAALQDTTQSLSIHLAALQARCPHCREK